MALAAGTLLPTERAEAPQCPPVVSVVRRPRPSQRQLETWNSSIQYQGWRTFWSSNADYPLGTYLGTPLSTSFIQGQTGITLCGADLVIRQRKRFQSPPIPSALSIKSPESRNLSLGTEILFDVPGVKEVVLHFKNSKWLRLSPADITYNIRDNPGWAEPLSRQKILDCFGQYAKMPVVESVIVADVIVEAKNEKGRLVDISSVLGRVGQSSILRNGLLSLSHRYTVSGITLARRTGLCTNSMLFFRNSNNQIGRDACLPVQPE